MPSNTTGQNNDPGTKYVWPIANGGAAGTQGQPCQGSHQQSGGWYSANGTDFMVPAGTEVVAVADGCVYTTGCNFSDPGFWGCKVYLKDKYGELWFYQHLNQLPGWIPSSGCAQVTQGQVLGSTAAGTAGGSHLHFAVYNGGQMCSNSVDALGNAPGVPGDGSAGGGGGGMVGADGGGGGGGVPGDQVVATALQAAFFATEFKSSDYVLAESLKGKSIGGANDISIMDWIKQACDASGRQFMSLPDGKLYFFYPDPFGLFGLKKVGNAPTAPDQAPAPTFEFTTSDESAYWIITPIEILDFSVQLTDNELTSHVYANFPHWPYQVGDISNWDRMMPTVASVMDQEALSVFLKTSAALGGLEFLERYGIRPLNIDLGNIRHPFLAWFACWKQFLLKWSELYECRATFTYMPEIYPGGRVQFNGFKREKLVTMYVEQVTHTFDRSSGFRTEALLSCPTGGVLNPFGLAPGGMSQIPSSTPDTESYPALEEDVDDNVFELPQVGW